MKHFMKKVNTAMLSLLLCFSFCVTAFAQNEEIRYPLTPTITPIRIFFAVLVVILFIASEIAFEKIREKRVKKRNKTYEKNKDK